MIGRISVICFVLTACTIRKGQSDPGTILRDERSFVYVYNCHTYLRADFEKLFGFIPDSTMLLATQLNFVPWSDSCEAIFTRSFPKYLGASIDRGLQQKLAVNPTGTFDDATAAALIKYLKTPESRGLLNEKQLDLALWGLESFGNKPIITEALYTALTHK